MLPGEETLLLIGEALGVLLGDFEDLEEVEELEELELWERERDLTGCLSDSFLLLLTMSMRLSWSWLTWRS